MLHCKNPGARWDSAANMAPEAFATAMRHCLTPMNAPDLSVRRGFAVL
jgi:hypothetical protein